MKKIWFVLLLISCVPIIGHAQLLSTSATITDSDSTVWAGGSGSVVLYSPNTLAYYNGTLVPTATQFFTLNGSGAFSGVSLYTTTTMTPVTAQYTFTICSNTSAPCSVFTTPVSTANLTSVLSALVTAPRFRAVAGAYGYADVEALNPVTGATYYNITSLAQRTYNGTAWSAGGSGGGITQAGSCSGPTCTFSQIVGTPSPGAAAAVGAVPNSTSTTFAPEKYPAFYYDIASATTTYSYPNEYFYNFDPAILPHLTGCIARAKINGGNCRILLGPGDSTTYGSFSNGTSSGDLYSGAYPTRLAQFLQNGTGLSAQTDSFVGGGQFSGNGVLANDPRVTAGTWTKAGNGVIDNGTTIGGSLLQQTSTGTAFTFTPINPVDTFRIWYPTGSGFGTIQVAIDGTNVTIINESATASFTSVTVTASAGVGIHKISLAATTGSPVYFAAIEATNSTISQIEVLNPGWGGSAPADWLAAGNAYSPFNALGVFAPDVCVIDLGINNWNSGTDVATYKTQMQSLITKCAVSADVILVTPAPGSTAFSSFTTVANQNNFVNAMYELAKTNNLPIIDNYSRFVSYAVSSAAPKSFYGDLQHPNGAGYSDFATGVYNAFISVIGGGNPNNPLLGKFTSIRSGVSTIASASSITPTTAYLNVTGTAIIATIVDASMTTTQGGCYTLYTPPTGTTFTWTTGGNILNTGTAVINSMYNACWNGTGYIIK